MRKYLSKGEVAERYQVSQHTVVSWVRRGYIPSIPCGRLIRFSPEILDEWDRKRMQGGREKLTPEVPT